jgi:hypothetical protein
MAQQRGGIGLDLIVAQQLGMRRLDVAHEIVPGEEGLLLLQRTARPRRRLADAALVVAQRGNAVARQQFGDVLQKVDALRRQRIVAVAVGRPAAGDQHDARHVLDLAEQWHEQGPGQADAVTASRQTEPARSLVLPMAYQPLSVSERCGGFCAHAAPGASRPAASRT